MKKIQLSLRWKIFIIVSLGLLFAYGLVAVFRIQQVKKSFMDELERSGRERAVLIAGAVANMIVAHDYGNLESEVGRIVELQDVQKVSIFNRDGKLMVARNNSKFTPEDIDFENPGELFVAPVIFSGAKVGSVELIVSRSRSTGLMASNYRTIYIAIALSTICFGFLIYAVVTIFVARPLLRLVKAADQLALGNYSAELPDNSRDEIGKLVNAFSAMRESRKLSERRLRAIFENSPDAFIQLDKDGNIVNWNDNAESVFGYSREEVAGRNFSMVLPAKELGLNNGYRKCYEKSENLVGVIREMVGQRKNRSLFPLELRTSEISFEDESAFLVSARDISERKENENKLLNAMNAAEAANAAKSIFLSNMSHEIRTPMNSIIGMTNLAFKTQLNAKQHDYLSKIDYAAKHLLSLINDILDFSKIEANKLELEIIDFSLSDVFDNLSSQLMHGASAKGLHLKLDLDPDLSVPLRGDRLRLTQVLLNLTSNAIKFTDKGEVNILARKLEEGAEDFLIRFEVRDTGIGLSVQEQAGLFKVFHQADASTTRKYGGTGLGLAISKQLAELMGGSVEVVSQPNAGSTFWFDVRLPRGNKTVTAQPATPLDLAVLKNVSVLVVEDNLFNQQVAVEMLREVGCGVTLANNGQEAIEMLYKRRFNCVLMDVQMPVMDGMEATRRIRANPALADTYIAAMTANAGREDRERCLAAGMNDFISKPVFAENLYALLARCMRSSVAQGCEETGAVQNGMAESAHKMPGDSIPASATGINHAMLIDLSVLGKMMGNDPAKTRKFAIKFLHSAQAGIAEIRQALEQENWAQLAALGHRNKSPARTVGANSFADLCLSLESFKHGGDIVQARKIVEKMDGLLLKIENEIGSEIV